MHNIATVRPVQLAAVTVLGIAFGLWPAGAQQGSTQGSTPVRPVPGILPLPDLVVDVMALDASASGGCVGGRRKLTMQVWIRNAGKGPAIMPNPKLNPWVGVHSTWAESGGGGKVSGNPFPKVTGPDALQPGQTHKFKIEISVANPPSGKPYSINATVDPNHLMGELNDNNNTKAWVLPLDRSQKFACPLG